MYNACLHVSVHLHFVLVQIISLIKFKLSIIITVEIFFAFYAYDNSYDGPLLSYSSVVGQMTAAITSCFLCDSVSFRSYCVSVQSAAVVHILCRPIDDVIVDFSRHGSVDCRPYTMYFPYKRCFKLR